MGSGTLPYAEEDWQGLGLVRLTHTEILLIKKLRSGNRRGPYETGHREGS